MTKQELLNKHDSAVREAIATELEHLTDADLEADDASERILVRLMAGATAAQSVHDRLRDEKADDPSHEYDYWCSGFRLEEALASVLWWFTTVRDSLELDEVALPCAGSAAMSAFGVFVAMRRLRMSCEMELASLTDFYGDDLQGTIREGVKTIPTDGM